MPTPAPIQGVTTLTVGLTTTLTDATAGGTWASDNTAVATVDANTGVVTGIGAGTANIIYTVDTDSIAVLFTVTKNTITNGYFTDEIYNAFKNRITWQYDNVTSESGRYFEDFHPLNNPTLIDDTRPQSTTSLTDYLANKTRQVINESINSVYNKSQIIDNTKLCFFRPDVMLVQQPVQNGGQFVGIKMDMMQGDFAVKFDSVELFFDQTVTFNMYLYNDMTLPPLYQISVTAQGGEQTIVDLSTNAIFKYLSPRNNKGGIWYFGYYQNDLGDAKAIYYNIANNMFHGCRLYSFSAPTYIDRDGDRNFRRNIIGANNLTYGLNISLSTYQDGTNDLIQNSNLLDNLIGLKMTARILQDMMFSFRSNKSQRLTRENISESQLYAELNGYKPSVEEPFVDGLSAKIEQETEKIRKSFNRIPKRIVGIS